MEKFKEKARVLVEALPYIRRFYGKRVVIKYGGHAMVDDDLKEEFALDVILMKYVGMNPIIVHGGGPQIGDMLKRVGKGTQFVSGLRVTDEETMEIVEMVLVGKINKELVSLINHLGGKAVGLSGKDGGLIRAKKLRVMKSSLETGQPEIIDIGLVGEVEMIDPHIITVLEQGGYIPVIAPVGVGERRESYNINADLAAGDIAAALKAEKFLQMTDVPGILDGKNQLIPSLNVAGIKDLISSGIINEGMLPKVQGCLKALEGGVSKTHIIDGRTRHSLLLEIFTDEGIGTEIVP
ncbi:MAG: acetylglutamate kinase [Candidatus Tectomicrobia bacterium]|nr:acetylglutamate kinase [Candidatus Tectomicrobia bacterium]